MKLTKDQRLAEYFKRLAAAPAARTADDAKALLAQTLSAMEDELTDIPNDPTQWASDGRMYPILEDNWEELVGGAWVGRSRRHRTAVGPNGAMEIRRSINGQLEFSKPGADGQGVPT
jgi:hypothetical protein